MKHFKLFLIIFGGAALSVHAQPVMVKNINPGAGSTFHLTEKYAVAGNKFYFVANDGTHGLELWKSDGTEAGTVLVRDIYPGTTQSGIRQLHIPYQGHLYFEANETSSGVEIWRTVDGPDGAEILSDACPGTCSGAAFLEAKPMAVLNNKLILRYYSPTVEDEIWESDGTASGTKLIKDINPGDADSRPQQMTVFQGKIYFVAENSSSVGYELWVTDGTNAGTHIVKDINPGPVGSSNSKIDAIVAGPDALYFWADNNTLGKELWRSDGTEAGTVLLKDVKPGVGNGAPLYPFGQFTWLGNQLLFVADDGIHGEELWITDGSQVGTNLVRDIYPGSNKSEILMYGVVNGKLLMRANDGVAGAELWSTDGTEAGTTLLKDILPGNNSALFSSVTSAVFQNYLFFSADNSTRGNELWISDGTTAGTIMHTDIRPGAASSNPNGFTLIGNTMFFFAETGSAGRELWKYDLTPLSASAPVPLIAAVFPTVSADGRFSVQAAEAGEGLRVEAFDLPGRLHTVRTLPVGKQDLDLSALSSGTYILRLTGTDSGRSTAVRVFVHR